MKTEIKNIKETFFQIQLNSMLIKRIQIWYLLK